MELLIGRLIDVCVSHGASGDAVQSMKDLLNDEAMLQYLQASSESIDSLEQFVQQVLVGLCPAFEASWDKVPKEDLEPIAKLYADGEENAAAEVMMLLTKLMDLYGLDRSEADLTDEAIIDYLDGAAHEMETVQEFVETVANFYHFFGDVEANERAAKLYEKFRNGTLEDNSDTESEKEAVQLNTSLPDNNNKSKKENRNGNIKAKSSPPPKKENEGLTFLLGLCPENANRQAILHVLEKKCNNNLEDAASYILEHEMEFIETMFLNECGVLQEKQKQIDLEEKKRVKKLLMDRFDEFAVIEPDSSMKTKKSGKDHRKAMKKAMKAQEQEKQSRKVRYFEGQIVSRNGEKYHVVDNGKTEYNGGSKGRVITKGKRGPGWVAG